MARKKSKAKKVATALLATVVLLGAAGTLAVGAMTDWSFKSEDLLPFKDVKIEYDSDEVYVYNPETEDKIPLDGGWFELAKEVSARNAIAERIKENKKK